MALRVVAIGAGAQVAGLAVDAWLHARDPGLAAREGPLSLGNAGHVLVLVGLALVVVGVAVGLGVARRAHPALLGVTGVVAALAVVAAAATAGGHDHEPGGTGTAHARLHDAHAEDDHDAGGHGAGARDAGAHDDAHAGFGPVTEEPLSAEEQAALDAQWATAVAAAGAWPTAREAEAAGYRQASAQAPGIGTHWIRWDLVDAPFDPARPSMLLFDQSPRGGGRLAGFSYWVRSAVTPDGFAGPNDHWHQHHGLCFVDGWLEREDVPASEACPGQWLQGGDRWMLHAWVVPGMENRWGRFAPRHPALCPPATATPDILSCTPLRS